MQNNHVLLVCATITTALIAGLFFGFVVAVNPAFAKLPDLQYISAMQAINRAIVNAVFAIAFFGPVIFIPLAAWVEKKPILWVAAVIYIVGGIGITYAVNVPLNNILDTFPVATASGDEAARARTAFVKPWNLWHLVRTIAVIISTLLLIIACLRRNHL
jgi:uncharacterized membrane protein